MVENLAKKRIESIDVLRGFVMVLMALDHTRDFFHNGVGDPLNLETTTTFLYFTRWVTHFCAPTFIFLTGISIYLQSLRKSPSQLSLFLIQRGIWLIFVEAAIISVGWTFNLGYEGIPLQVIWAIGISMTLMGILVLLPFNVILSIGLLIVLGHNLLDYPESAPGFRGGFWWDLLHNGKFSAYHVGVGHKIFIVYPFLPWLGLMMIGYCVGRFFLTRYEPLERRKIFVRTGFGLIMIFVALRMWNQYGDPDAWTVQNTVWFTVLSFLNVHKYPPSLLYMCITIGQAFLFLAWVESVQNSFTKHIKIFGRVAFFYYILHLYLIHFLSVLVFTLKNYFFKQVQETGGNHPLNLIDPGEGFGLPGVYLAWIVVILMLYPVCKWYDEYKTRHKEKWWLSYL